MSNSRISSTYPEFDADIKKFYTHLHTLEPDGITLRGITLGLLSPDLAELKNRRFLWANDDPTHPGLYDLFQNENTRTSTISKKTSSFIKEFKVFFQPLLNIMAASRKITADDRAALNIADPVTSHSVPTEPIAEKCFIKITMIGGGKVKFRCQTTTDSSRASKPALADAAELAIRIDLPYVAADSSSGDLAGKVRSLLVNADDKTTKSIHTKATFTMDLGEGNTGNVLQIYARWINTKHPNLNGPWTGPIAVIIG
jgi:hypothetical protein